ncbi:TPA: ParA family protein [Vibrio diabolicus]
MSIIMAIANQKGGVGKTTCTYNFGISIANQGNKCLFLDFDPQNNLGGSIAPEMVENPEYTSVSCLHNAYNLFENPVKAKPFEVSENVHVIGGDKRMGNITQSQILNVAESIDLIKDDYDYIFIDCPPAANALQHAALLVASKLLIISQAQKMSIKGVNELVKTSRQIRRMNPDLEVLGIVLNLIEANITNDQREQEAELRKEYGNLVFENKLIKTTRVSEALNQGKALIETNPKAADKFGFTAVCDELCKRMVEVTA